MQSKQLTEKGKKDLLLATQLIAKSVESDDSKGIEAGVLWINQGYGILKAAQIIEPTESSENELRLR